MTAAASRLRRLVPLWLLFAVPLAVLMAANDYVIQPKWNAVHIAGWSLVAFVAVMPALHPVPRHPILPALGAWLFFLALGVGSAPNPWQAMRLSLEQGALLAIVMLAAGGTPDLGRALVACAGSIVAQAYVAFEQARGNWIVGHGEQFGAGRIYATLGNPSFFGVYLAPVAVWLGCGGWFAARDRAWVRAGWMAAACAAAVVMLWRAEVMDGWAGLALATAVCAWLVHARGHSSPFRSLGVAAAVLAAGIVVTAFALAPLLHDRLDYLRVKAFSWHAAAWLWRDAPVLGSGPGSFQTLAPQMMARVHALWTGTWGVRETLVAPHDEAFAHQDFLQMLAEGGTVGYGIWCWLVVIAVRIGWRAVRAGDRDRIAFLGGLAAFLPTMALHFPLHLAPSALVFWLGLGWAASVPPTGGGRPIPAGGRAGLVVVFLSVCILATRALTVNVLTGEGYRLLRGGAPQLAVPMFRRAEALDAHNFEERFYAGAAFQAVHDEDAAIVSYGAAIALYPGMVGARYNLGNVYFGRRDYGTAVRIYRETLAIDPTHLDAINNLGNSLALAGHYDEARSWYLRALSLRPDYPEGLYNLAVNAWRRGDRRDARKWLTRALAADPAYPPAREFAATMGLPIR